MPWKEISVMEERLRFFARRLEGAPAAGPLRCVRQQIQSGAAARSAQHDGAGKLYVASPRSYQGLPRLSLP